MSFTPWEQTLNRIHLCTPNTWHNMNHSKYLTNVSHCWIFGHIIYSTSCLYNMLFAYVTCSLTSFAFYNPMYPFLIIYKHILPKMYSWISRTNMFWSSFEDAWLFTTCLLSYHYWIQGYDEKSHFLIIFTF